WLWFRGRGRKRCCRHPGRRRRRARRGRCRRGTRGRARTWQLRSCPTLHLRLGFSRWAEDERPDTFEGEVIVAFVEVDADGVVAVAGGYGEGCAGAGERVQHDSGAPVVMSAVRPAESDLLAHFGGVASPVRHGLAVG